MIKKFFGHLKTVTIHRWWVFYYCCKAGIPIQGLLHDLSKFSPVEFFESVKYYQGNRSPIDACKELNGWSACWLHHKGKNKHHYQYWIDGIDKGCRAIDMPFKYKVEMICDFMGAGRAYSGKAFTYEGERQWWIKKKANCPDMLVHPLTIKFIDEFMDDIAVNGDEAFKRLRR